MAEDAVEHAERLVDTIEASIRTLLEFPGAGRLRAFRSPRALDIRTWVVRGSPYLIVYRATPSQITVLRILHGARDRMLLSEGEA
jgi:toxin ParE1/3/4